MKRLVSYILTVVLCLAITPVAMAGVTFSVYPDQPVGASNLGIEFGPLGVYGGVDVLGVKFSDNDKENVSGTSVYSVNATGTIVIPSVGGKLRFAPSATVSPYIRGSYGLVKPSVTLSGNPEDEEYLKELQDEINSAIAETPIVALHGALGMEYAFAPGFALAGEYGIRYFKLSHINEYTDSTATKMTETIALHYNATYSSVGLVFRF